MMGGKWIEYPVGTGVLAIANVGGEWRPSDQGTGAALEVENFDEAIDRLKEIKYSVCRALKRPFVTWRWCKIPTETN